MQGGGDQSPEVQLNLPERGSIDFDSLEIREIYSQFLDQLQIVSDENVILSNPYFFSVETNGISESLKNWLASLTEADLRKLLLLSLICRPFDASSLWPQGQPKFLENDPILQALFPLPYTVSLAEEESGIPYGLDVLPERRKVLSDPGLKRLMDTIPVKTPIETLSAEFIGEQPGNYGHQMWQVSEWSNDWAVVYGVTDAGHLEGYPFPWLLGFCRRNRVERNFIALLCEGSRRFDIGFYSTYGTVYGSWDMAKLTLHVEDGYEQPDWDLVYELLSLDDDALEAVLQEEKGKDLGTLMSRIRNIRESADSAGLAENSLAELMKKAGGAISLGAIEDQIPKWQTE